MVVKNQSHCLLHLTEFDGKLTEFDGKLTEFDGNWRRMLSVTNDWRRVANVW
ncbi:hypothetical protein Hanom_Chr00s002596g01701841 [Helianthus anomalus]